MLEAKRQIAKGKECSRLIIAEEQSQGRGRYGRIWFAPKGNLYFTYTQPIEHPIEQIPLIAGTAVAFTLQKFITHPVTLKPPNDVLVNGKKISGILVEKHDFLFSVGIGINVTSSPLVQFYETTFVHKYNKNPRIGNILRCFLEHYHVLLKQDFSQTQDQYNKLSLCS